MEVLLVEIIIQSNTFICFPGSLETRWGGGGGAGTPIHYLYGYVSPNGVVILKLLV